MKIFNLDNDYKIICNWVDTRSGFKHTAILYKNGLLVFETKICYLNRTWESFEYESVLKKVIDNYFKGNIDKKGNKRIKFLQIIKEMILC